MKQIIQIRFDPGSSPDTISIKSISLHGWTKKISWGATELINIIQPLNNIEKTSYKNNMVHITTNGNDPYFLFTGDFNNILRSINNKIRIIYLYLISFILSTVFLIFLYILNKPISFLIQLFKKLIKIHRNDTFINEVCPDFVNAMKKFNKIQKEIFYIKNAWNDIKSIKPNE